MKHGSAKHAAKFNMSNYEIINLHQQNGRTVGGVCIFIRKFVDFKERKNLSISNNDSEILLSNLLTKQKISFSVQFIGHPILV